MPSWHIRFVLCIISLFFCREHITAVSGEDYYAINPKGNVPCLILNDGTVLTDIVSIMTCIGGMVKNYITLNSI